MSAVRHPRPRLRDEYGKESADVVWCYMTKDPRWCYGAWQFEDIKDNSYGRSCPEKTPCDQWCDQPILEGAGGPGPFWPLPPPMYIPAPMAGARLRRPGPRQLSGGHALRKVGEFVASRMPALDAAPWFASAANGVVTRRARTRTEHAARRPAAVASARLSEPASEHGKLTPASMRI